MTSFSYDLIIPLLHLGGRVCALPIQFPHHAQLLRYRHAAYNPHSTMTIIDTPQERREN